MRGSGPTPRAPGIVLCNTVLVFAILWVIAGGIVEARTFANGLQPYGFARLPLRDSLVWVARLKWFDLICVCALVCGGIAEPRRSKWAGAINPVVYACQIGKMLWYSPSDFGGSESIPPLKLLGIVLFVVVPVVGLFLYRHDVARRLSRRGAA